MERGRDSDVRDVEDRRRRHTAERLRTEAAERLRTEAAERARRDKEDQHGRDGDVRDVEERRRRQADRDREERSRREREERRLREAADDMERTRRDREDRLRMEDAEHARRDKEDEDSRAAGGRTHPAYRGQDEDSRAAGGRTHPSYPGQDEHRGDDGRRRTHDKQGARGYSDQGASGGSASAHLRSSRDPAGLASGGRATPADPIYQVPRAAGGAFQPSVKLEPGETPIPENHRASGGRATPADPIYQVPGAAGGPFQPSGRIPKINRAGGGASRQDVKKEPDDTQRPQPGYAPGSIYQQNKNRSPPGQFASGEDYLRDLQQKPTPAPFRPDFGMDQIIRDGERAARMHLQVKAENEREEKAARAQAMRQQQDLEDALKARDARRAGTVEDRRAAGTIRNKRIAAARDLPGLAAIRESEAARRQSEANNSADQLLDAQRRAENIAALRLQAEYDALQAENERNEAILAERQERNAATRRHTERARSDAPPTPMDVSDSDSDHGSENERPTAFSLYTCNICRYRRPVLNARQLSHSAFKCSQARHRCGEIADNDENSREPVGTQRFSTRPRNETEFLTEEPGESAGSKPYRHRPNYNGHPP